MKRGMGVMGILGVLGVMCLAGCSTNNRNIVCVESSGLAIIASYNPQTELPEVKLGYFRGLFFIIPTGLNTDPGGTGGRASDVPTVIVKQTVNGGFTTGVQIDNRFIVGTPDEGQEAVAKSLFVDDALMSGRACGQSGQHGAAALESGQHGAAALESGQHGAAALESGQHGAAALTEPGRGGER